MYDLFVIGGGSGGVRCARVAASLGARVGIAESRFWGGTCVNVGCVPKKIMVQAAEYGAYAQDSRGFGWDGPAPRHDWATLIAHKDREIGRLNQVYTKLLTSSGVDVFDAHAKFVDAHTLDVGGQTMTAKHIVIATGGKATRLTIPGAELGVISDDIFALPTRPARAAIIGGGYIGIEFAGILHGLGSDVTLIYRQDLPLRGFDQDLRVGLADAMAQAGIKILARHSPAHLERGDHGDLRLTLDDHTVIDTDLVLFATGRAPNITGLGLDAIGVDHDAHDRIAVDAQYRTSVPHIYAIGDVAAHQQLTPVAIAQGHRLAERIFGGEARSWDFTQVPTAVFSSPPLATCGLTEDQAAQAGPVDIYMTQFTPMRHNLSQRARRTMMKLVVDQATQRVVGAHMLGDDAPEMMQAIAVAMVAGVTKKDFDRTIGIHPTAAEEFVTMRTKTRSVG